MCPQRPHVMGNQRLRPLDDPREVADAKLARLGERRRQRQPGRVGKRVCPPGGKLGSLDHEPPLAQLLSHVEIQTQQVTVIARHRNMLTAVQMIVRG